MVLSKKGKKLKKPKKKYGIPKTKIVETRPYKVKKLMKKIKGKNSKKIKKNKIIKYDYVENFNLGVTITTDEISEKKNIHYIKDVEKDGLGYKLGIRNNDKIIKVNNKYVTRKSHSNIMQRILPDDYPFMYVIKVSKNNFPSHANRFRPQRGENFGLLLADTNARLEEGEAICAKGTRCSTDTVVTKVVKNSIADKVGFNVGDKIIGINGESTANLDANHIMKLFNPGPKKMTLKLKSL